MEIKKQIITFIILVICIPSVLAVISIDSNVKQSYEYNNEIKIAYSISSDEEISIAYVAGVECPSSPIPLLELIEVDLNAGTSKTAEYLFADSLPDNTVDQTCKFRVSILEPFEQVYEKDFEINGLRKLGFTPMTCGDPNCDNRKLVFLKNQPVYISYRTDIEPSIIGATLIFPDSSIQKISLPYSFSADITGSYEINIVATKSGYITETKKLLFAVNEKQVEIQTIAKCNVNGKCSGEETVQNCPQDCSVQKTQKTAKSEIKKSSISVSEITTTTLQSFSEIDPMQKSQGMILLIAVIIVALLLVFIDLKRRKKI